jgi:chemotaxis protein CheC
MKLTSIQLDSLKELLNIGIGRGADVLNTMLQSQIHLRVPYLRIFTFDELQREIETLNSSRLAAVSLGFKGHLAGIVELIFPTESASKLVEIITGEQGESRDLDSLRVGALCEIGNVVLNGVMGSIGNLLQEPLHFSIPTYMEQETENLLAPFFNDPELMILLARTRFSIEETNIDGDIALFLDLRKCEGAIEGIDTWCRSTWGESDAGWGDG